MSTGSNNANAAHSPDDDVVITGLGIVSPLGIGHESVWESLRHGRSGVSIQSQWQDTPLRLAAAVDESFDPRQYIKPRKSLKVMCREIQLGVAAAGIALEDAALPIGQLDPFRVGVVLGTDIMHAPPSELSDTYLGCTIDGQFDFSHWYEQAQRKLNPLFMLKYLPNMAASHVAIAHDAQGPCNTLVMGEISGLLSLIEAADIIASGRADAMLAGGSGCSLNLSTLVYHGVERLTQRIGEPIATPAPFDLHRDGTVVGEGAGVVVLERRHEAVRRGAKIYGTLAGYARGMSYHPAADDAKSQVHVLREAIRRSGLNPEALDHVNATGRASQEADQREAIAIREVLGDCPVVAPSAAFGTLSAAGSIVEMLVSLLAAQHGHRPATLNFQTPDPLCPVNVCTQVTPLQQPAFIKLAATATGQTASIVTRLES